MGDLGTEGMRDQVFGPRKREGEERGSGRIAKDQLSWQWLRAGQVSPASLFGASDVTFFRSPSNRREVLSVRWPVRFQEGEKQICEGRA